MLKPSNMVLSRARREPGSPISSRFVATTSAALEITLNAKACIVIEVKHRFDDQALNHLRIVSMPAQDHQKQQVDARNLGKYSLRFH